MFHLPRWQVGSDDGSPVQGHRATLQGSKQRQDDAGRGHPVRDRGPLGGEQDASGICAGTSEQGRGRGARRVRAELRVGLAGRKKPIWTFTSIRRSDDESRRRRIGPFDELDVGDTMKSILDRTFKYYSAADTD